MLGLILVGRTWMKIGVSVLDLKHRLITKTFKQVIMDTKAHLYRMKMVLIKMGHSTNETHKTVVRNNSLLE